MTEILREAQAAYDLRDWSRARELFRVLTTIGLGGHTITAWEDAEAPRRILGAAAHKEAVTTFFGSSFTSDGMTSVWVPQRMHAWHRCDRCGQMAVIDDRSRPRICKCGAALPDDFRYW